MNSLETVRAKSQSKGVFLVQGLLQNKHDLEQSGSL